MNVSSKARCKCVHREMGANSGEESDMKFEDLSPEMQEKAKAAQTPEEVLALAKAEGYELTDEELEDITGGLSWNSCPGHNFKRCQSHVTTESPEPRY